MNLANKIILCVLYLLLCNIANSQLSEDDITISTQAGHLSLKGFSPRNTIGLNIDIMATDKIGFHYNFDFSTEYSHIPLTLGGGVFLIQGLFSKSAETAILGYILGAVFTVVPEGISYNIPFNKNLGLSPYFSPLQFDYIRKDNQTKGTDSYAGGALGLKFNALVLKNIKISTFVEFKMHYNKQTHPGLWSGVSFGYRLKTKKDFESERLKSNIK